MKKRLLALLLCLSMLLSFTVSTYAEGNGDLSSHGYYDDFEDVAGSGGNTNTDGDTTEIPVVPAPVVPAPGAPTQPGFEEGNLPGVTVCEECGAANGHTEDCSQYVAPKDDSDAKHEYYKLDQVAGACKECGKVDGHLETCSQYVAEVLMPPAEFEVEAVIAYINSLETEEAVDEYLATLSEEELEAIYNYLDEQSFAPPVLTENPEFKGVGPIISSEIIEQNVITPVAAAYTVRSAARTLSQSNAVAFNSEEAPIYTVGADGSYEYEDGLVLNKTVKQVSDGVYNITLSASTESVIATSTNAVDIVLMLDLSGHMGSSSYVATTKTMSEWYEYSGTFYFDSSGTQKVTGNRRWYGDYYGYYYTFYANNRQVADGSASKQETFYIESTASSSDKLTALQTAVRTFIDGVAEKSPTSRIAIVTYGNTATVETGSQTAQEGALRFASGDGLTELHSVVDALEIVGGASNSDYALVDAVQIFQDVPTDSEYYARDRVAILFSAGVAGDGNWSGNGATVAQGSMHVATILKATKGASALSETDNPSGAVLKWTDNFYGEKSSMFTKDSFESRYGLSTYTGCGATVYTVGLDLPATADPAEEWIWGTDGARVNEYMYRISHHRPDGAHWTPDDSRYEWLSAWEAARAQLGEGDWYNNGYGFYADQYTRNLTDGYFLTATGDNLDQLTDIFEQISNQVGKSFDVTIKDYIDPGFDIVSGQTGGGTASEDANGSYIQWDNVELTPGDENGKGALSFTKTIQVKVDENFLGGNDVPTNIGGISAVYGDKTYPFPQPTVDVPTKAAADASNKTIYVTNSVVDLDYLPSGIVVDGATNAYVTITHVVTVGEAKYTYTIPAGETEGTWANEAPPPLEPDQDTQYTVTTTVTPVTEGDIGAASDSDSGTIYVLTPEAVWNDKTIYLGGTPVYDTPAVSWVNDNTDSPAVSGTAPAVTFSYDIAAANFDKSTCTLITPTLSIVKNGVTEYSAVSEDTFTVHILKPTVTWKDESCYYGATFPTSFTPVSTTWKCEDGNTTATNGTDAPKIAYIYTPKSTLVNGLMADSDVDVAVSAKIGETVIQPTYLWEKADGVCKDTCTAAPTDAQFRVHPLYCSLTINKTVTNAYDANDTFLFNVVGDNDTYHVDMDVVIQGSGSVTIGHLPVGKYTVTEDKTWSWRYDITDDQPDSKTLSSVSASQTWNITNTLGSGNKDKWLTFSGVAENTWSNGIGENFVMEGTVTEKKNQARRKASK